MATLGATRSQAYAIDSFGLWVTNSERALADDNLYAETNLDSDSLYMTGFNFADIPAGSTISGFEATIQAYRVDDGSPSLLYLTAAVGTSVASFFNVKRTPLLGLSENTFTVGGSADTWGGHSWTLAEVQAAGFAMRIRSETKAGVGTPLWRLEYAVLTVYWNNPTGASYLPVDLVPIVERVTTSMTGLRVREALGINDGSKYAGTAISDIRTDPTFTSAAQKRLRKDAVGCRIIVSDNGSTGAILFIGDSTLANVSSYSDYPINLMQPGLVSVGEIQMTGDFGEDWTPPTCSVRLLNKTYSDQRTALSSTPKTLAEHCAGQTRVGLNLVIWAFVESGDGWFQRIMFYGSIEEMDIGETHVEIHAIQSGTAAAPVPNLYIDSNLFTYEPGSSGVDTGEEIASNRGKPIPIGIGRFDLTAVKKEGDFATGHPFRFSPGQSGVPADRKIYSNAATFPAMWGVLFPMMPTIWAAKNYRRKNAQVGSLSFTSWPYQNVFLFGSRKSSPEFGVMTGPSVSDSYNMICPGWDWANIETPFGLNTLGNERQSLQYITIWTWQSEGDRGFAVPFVRDWTTRNVNAQRVLEHHSAGSMDVLGYPNKVLADWTDGTANSAYGVFLNSGLPSQPLATLPNVRTWMGLIQAAALPMEQLTNLDKGAVHPYARWPARDTVPGESGAPREWVSFQTTSGVDNPLNCIKLDNFEDTSRINAGEFLSMQCPKTGPNLGTMLGIRFWVLWNNSSSTATTLYGFFKFGVNWLRGFGPPGVQVTNNLEDWGSVYSGTDISVGGQTVQSVKWTISANRPGGSVWMLPFWDDKSGVPAEVVDGTKPKNASEVHAHAKGQWDFTSWDRGDRTPGGTIINEYPWDVMLHVTSGFADIVACWMEVIYQSPFDKTGVAAFHRGETIQLQQQLQEIFPGVRIPVGPSSREGPRFFSFANERRKAEDPSGVWLTGRGAIDGSGEITGTADRLIENPADVSNAIIRHYLGSSVFSDRAIASELGSFTTARTLLGATTYRGTYVVDEQLTIREVLGRIAAQARGFCAEQLNDSGFLSWRFFVEDADPATNDTARLYRTDGFGFHWDDLVKDSLQVSFTPIEDLSSNVRVRYGLHRPSGKWSNEAYCRPDATNFATNGTAYKAAMDDVARNYGVSNALTVDAPDIWDPTVAETLCKWACDRVRRRRVQVEFQTYANGLDLVPGHVIKMDDEIGQRIVWPGIGATNWNAHQLNVTRTYPRRDQGRPWIVGVRAVEVYTKAA